jgi:hypothetical protein
MHFTFVDRVKLKCMFYGRNTITGTELRQQTALRLGSLLYNVDCTGWSKSLCAPDDYSTKNTHKLKMAIPEYFRIVDCAILNTVFKNTVWRVSKCLETGREHIEHYFLYCNGQVHGDFLINLYMFLYLLYDTPLCSHCHVLLIDVRCVASSQTLIVLL